MVGGDGGLTEESSGLLMLTVVGLTARTAWTFASGDTFVYFVEPAR